MPDKHTKQNVYHAEILSLSIGALAGGAAIIVASGSTMGMSGRVKVMQLWSQVSGLTTLEGTQLVIGVAAQGLTAAEIAEKLTATPDDIRDNEPMEFGTRFARIIMGAMHPGSNAIATAFFNDSTWFKLLLEFIEDRTMYSIFVFNTSTSTVTTGAVLKINVESLLRFFE